MPLDKLIADNAFSAEQIQAMTAAYESALAELKLGGGGDAAKEELANAVVTVASSGERDPGKIKRLALMILIRED